MKNSVYDVIVVGGGNAALCAALSAREQVQSVLVLERAPENKRGGNSAFTAGSFRMVHNGLETIRKMIPDLSDEEIARTDFGEYTAEQYLDDLGRVTQYYIDPDLAEIIVRESTGTVQWIKEKANIRFVPMYGRYAFSHHGRFKFFGGTVVQATGGGVGLVDTEYRAAARHGIEMRYGAQATALLRGPAGVEGVRVLSNGIEEEVRARSVVLACGGFEANREWRTRYLGPGWDLAKVRGSRYNTGDGIRMALDLGGPSPMDSGRGATRFPGSAMRRISVILIRCRIPIVTATPSASWSMRTAGDSWMKELTFAITLMRNMAASFCSSPRVSPGRSLTRRSRTCCGMNTSSGALPRCRQTRWRNLSTSCRTCTRRSFMKRCASTTRP